MFRSNPLASPSFRSVVSRIGVAALWLGVAALAMPLQAQTFRVIHEFQGPEAWLPESGLTLDAAGNLYGTTVYATGQQGTVYRMKPSGSGWLFTTLYYFNVDAGQNGYFPQSNVVFGPGGALYGTTSAGGSSQLCEDGCGVFYALRAPQNPCHSVQCLWTESVSYRFAGEHDALLPGRATLLFDSAGNVYGTSSSGGDNGLGTVYELTKSNGVWRESVLYSFRPGTDAAQPDGGLVMDAHGNLYGTTIGGGQNLCQGVGCGTVFELSPSGSGWTETIIHSFQGSDGSNPIATLTLGPSGEIYGSTTGGGSANAGVLFELSPSGSGWNFSVLYQFPGNLYGGPYGALVLDAAGNLYGTTISDGANGLGSVFKLTHSNGGWNYTALHDFAGADDGKYPWGGPVFDSRGNLYGTAGSGGTGTCGGGHMCGTVWMITP